MDSDDDDILAAMRLLDDSPPPSPSRSAALPARPAAPLRLPGAAWAFLRDPAYARALDACSHARALEARIWDSDTAGSDGAAAAEYARACGVYPLQVEGYHRLALLLLRGSVTGAAVAAAAGLLRVAAKNAARLRGIPPPWNGDDLCKAEVAAGKAAEQRLVLLLFSQAAEKKDGAPTVAAAAAEAEARKLLQQMGYEATLAPEILRSDCFLKSESDVRSILASSPFTDRQDPESGIFFKLQDSVLPSSLLTSLQSGFAPSSPFWRVHNYGDSAPFFSYLYRFSDPPKSSLEQSICHLWRRACSVNPAVSRATVAEWWVHSRPHPHGHQLHYDSDDEGRGGVRHPIQGSVFFVQGHVPSETQDEPGSGRMVGGATMIANQRLSHSHLASQAWLVPPRTNRYMMFDGRYLHGVMPGSGPAPLTSASQGVDITAAAEAAVKAEVAAEAAVSALAAAPRPAPASSAEDSAATPAASAASAAARAAAAAVSAAPGGFARRVTFMVAYWDSIDARPRPRTMGELSMDVRGDEACPVGAGGAKHGAAMVVEVGEDKEWLDAFPIVANNAESQATEVPDWGRAREGMPAWVPRAWEQCDGRPHPSATAEASGPSSMPAYEKCFQGL